MNYYCFRKRAIIDEERLEKSLNPAGVFLEMAVELIKKVLEGKSESIIVAS